MLPLDVNRINSDIVKLLYEIKRDKISYATTYAKELKSIKNTMLKSSIIPKEVQKIYTFYGLELIYSSMVNSNKWYPQHEIDRAEIDLYLYSQKLKIHLLEIVEYSVCCEVRHTLGESDYHNNKTEFTRKENNLIKSYHEIGGGRSGAYRHIKSKIPSAKDRVEFCLKAFNLNWECGYGGDKWAEGCRTWLKLYKAEKLSDIVFWIDRVYDLQHNSGVLFNKHKNYDGIDYFVENALTEKRYAKDIFEVVFKRKFSNPYQVWLLPRVLPKYYKTFTRYLKHFSPNDNRRLIELSIDENQELEWYAYPTQYRLFKNKQLKLLRNEYSRKRQPVGK